MRLATFVRNGSECFGLVLNHPATGEDWIFVPGPTEKQLHYYAARPTSPFFSTRPVFAGEAGWPADLAALLRLGDSAMSQLRRLEDELRRFLEQTDQYMLLGAGFPVRSVTLRAPIPRPGFVWGLVQNSPAFLRHAPGRRHVNLFPQGHQRPQGTVMGPGDPVVIPAEAAGRFGWNPEMGVIIGRGGRDIPIDAAMSYVAGLTVVTDAVPFFYWKQVHAQPQPLNDWFEDAMGSWGDKKSDTMCPIGPYLTTLDEVGNPYDLLITSRQSGWVRDRSHTSAMLLGIERTISWLSSFRALQPGDIIHMASMGVDGLPTLDAEKLPAFSESAFHADDYIECEIERIGTLRNPIVIAGHNDWREPDHPSRRIHPAPAVRDLFDRNMTRIASPEDWQVSQARHFWTLFGNYRLALEYEGLLARPYPRFLNAPATALAGSGHAIRLAQRAAGLQVGCELACVVGKLASKVDVNSARDFILGYMVLAVVRDSSFADEVIEPATAQERYIPSVYARWGDGYNVVSSPRPLAWEQVANSTCRLTLDEFGGVSGSTAEYLHTAPEVLAFISQQITLFPGDVITLGPLAEMLEIPADRHLPSSISGYAEIDGVGRVTFSFDDRRASVT